MGCTYRFTNDSQGNNRISRRRRPHGKDNVSLHLDTLKEVQEIQQVEVRPRQSLFGEDTGAFQTGDQGREDPNRGP